MSTGRRLPDTMFGELPVLLDDFQPGDYWKYLSRTREGESMSASEWSSGRHEFPSNLTQTVWGYYSPDGNGMGTLVSHTVREHDDGTASVRPGDGSSNSILHTGGAQRKTWHGYIEHGEWTEC